MTETTKPQKARINRPERTKRYTETVNGHSVAFTINTDRLAPLLREIVC